MRAGFLCAAVSVALMALSSTGSWAKELEIASVSEVTPEYYEIIIPNTTKGVAISCALYNKAGKVVAAETSYTNNLATKVIIRYVGKDATGARCVEN